MIRTISRHLLNLHHRHHLLLQGSAGPSFYRPRARRRTASGAVVRPRSAERTEVFSSIISMSDIEVAQLPPTPNGDDA